MSKYYKYIISIFLLICIANMVYLFVPKNPLRENVTEVILEENVNDYIKNNELNKYDFSNFEKNQIKEMNLKRVKRKGRNVDPINYISEIKFLYSYFYSNDGNIYKYYPSEDDSLEINSYLFDDNKTILIKVRMGINSFKNKYFISIPNSIHYGNVSYGYTYLFDNKEYCLNDLGYGKFEKDNNENFYSDEYIIFDGSNKKYNLNINNIKINISFFLKYDQLNNKQAFNFNIITTQTYKKYSYTMGLNSISQYSKVQPAYVKTSYLEF